MLILHVKKVMQRTILVEFIYQQALTMLIAGQPKQHALMLLTKITGIQHATIAGITDDTPVPLDPAHIHFQVFVGL